MRQTRMFRTVFLSRYSPDISMTQKFASASELSAYLDNLNFFHMDLSLSRMEMVLKAMHLERPPYIVCQVVGTNGKGSTATFTASLLRAHGIRTGLYTSPHFFSPEERIQCDGQWTRMSDWLGAASEAVSICPDLTYFEILTVTALAVFRDLGVQCAVLEAGLGAQHDATTACASDLAVFAPIALDHTALLGSTVTAIAAEKAHAIRSDAPAVTAAQEYEVLAVLKERAAMFAAPLSVAPRLEASYALGLAGGHQYSNAGTALAAFNILAKKLGIEPDEAAVRKGLAEAFLPGRLQTVPSMPAAGSTPARPLCVLDGAHNPHGMQSLTKALHTGAVRRPGTVVYSCLKDKDWRTGLAQLAKEVPGASWHIPAIPGERSEKPENVVRFLEGLGEKQCTAHASLKEAFMSLDRAELQGTVLVTGSLYLLSTFYEIWPEALHRN